MKKVTMLGASARSKLFWRRIFVGLSLLLSCAALIHPLVLRAQAPEPQAVSPSVESANGPSNAAVAYRMLLPLVSKSLPLSYRLGYGASNGLVASLPDVRSLRAGWYLNWNVQSNPARPNGMEFVQVIRVHQQLTCPLYSVNAHDRTACPFVSPPNYVISPGWAEIELAVRANPGSLWLIGNEMDRRDWQGGGQDETLPGTYATAYHDLHTFIKGIDPSAQVAIGGVIQATPWRLNYLTMIWDAYQSQYGPMPVDVWNVHNFILRESFDGHGAGIPPGINDQPFPTYDDADHLSMSIFDTQIRAFRQWMKARGQQNKPLIVSEYGVLYSHLLPPENPYWAPWDTPQEVENFMIATFDYFLNTKDCSLGYAADDCRLVQRWAWYSLDDRYGGFNPYSALFDPATLQITGTGVKFRDYSLSNMSSLQR